MKNLTFNSVLSIASLGFTLMACGPQAYVPSAVSSKQQAPGGMNIPPKVDIVMGISSAGTMKNIFPNLTSEIPTFAKNLEASGWDYRFITVPLSEYADMVKLHTTISNTYNAPVSTSHFDSNYAPLGLWLAPFPGANSNDPSLGISANLFSQIFVFPDVGSIQSAANDAHETGFQNQLTYLNRADVKTQLLRKDAMLAMITLSNGEDRSGGNWNTTSWNGQTWTQTDPYFDSNFATSMVNLKGSAALVKYYALVAHQTNTCRGYGSWSGVRYENMAGTLGGISVDICKNPISAALDAVSANLQITRLSFVKTSLVIGTKPNPNTIVVTKYLNGDANQAVVLKQDGSNGWSFDANAGVQTVYTITQPVNMDQQTGYIIHLNGSAQLTGNDTATVDFLNEGAVAAH